ncbi:hypothetical protein GCK72_010785 [Caenorhabditis remanei]|uniref:NADAR domain-containing protein n=1 Tax=Caenorhabditis remanei TaxID=31234 RepID=A0A6A5H7N5_CAERE|nr:hypothetical protein GCK72_010785 [Caenorhabditis remanei]KAF1762523.1 hypothetical protein GCK72_010785 [Caenorhabditis remanei]
MDEDKIVLIGNETDLLHSGYNFAIKAEGKRFPSSVHFTHHAILASLKLPDPIIDELLCTTSSDVQQKAMVILQENMPDGHDLNTLGGYLMTSLHSYSLQGLRLRAEHDKEFERTLMKTNEALLIVCDEKNAQVGIGMDDKTFMEWMAKEKADSRQISYWMKHQHTKPSDLGHNWLGKYLMWLRFETQEKRKQGLLQRETFLVPGISKEKDDKVAMISINDLLICLEGIFRPLSNYYAFPFEMKGERYRSVEHYAYEKLFNSLKLDDKAIEKIQTTPVPLDVPTVAGKVLRSLEISAETIAEKTTKMDRWRQSAMKHKIYHNEYLQQLLLSTGSAILVDTSIGDPVWTCCASETELQHLLTKPYVTPQKLIGFMLDGEQKTTPKSLRHLYGNKSGLLLMELRERMSIHTTSRIPLLSAINTAPLKSIVTPNVICFTPESVFHPLYPAEIRCSHDGPPLPSPAHYVATQAAKLLNINKEDTEYILEETSSIQCWQRLHEVIELRGRGLELEQTWWMDKRMQFIKESLQLLFDQHPPLLRCLLDTGDSLLVYCSRFSSMDAELSIGMREMDFRWWMQEVGMSTQTLIDMCSHPMAFRPPYLGGNRLGLILMELRREFVLQGVFPQQLPELQLTPDSILGTNSPSENFMTSEHFDILQPWNYTALWINPLFLLAKDGHPEAMVQCTRIKTSPRMVTIDDEKVTEMVQNLVTEESHDATLGRIAAEDLRAVFMKLCGRLRTKMETLDRQAMEIAMVAMETHRLQSIRRSLSDTNDRSEDGPSSSSGPSISAPPVPSNRPRTPGSHPPSSSSYRMPAGRERDRDDDRDGRERDRERDSRLPSSASSSAIAAGIAPGSASSSRKERMEYKIPTTSRRKFGKDRERGPEKSSMSSDRGRDKDIPSKKRPHTSPPSRKTMPSSPKKTAPTPVTPAPVVPPKPKRNPDEELSDGEILSTDEEDSN